MINWFALLEHLHNAGLLQVPRQRPKRVLKHLGVPELLAAILQPDNRSKAIIEFHQRCEKQKVLAHAIYVRPGILSAIILEIMNHTTMEGEKKNMRNTCDVISAVIKILKIILEDQRVRKPFLSTGILFYLIPFLNYATVNTDPTSREADLKNVKHLRISLLSLFTFVAQKLTVGEMEELLLGPTIAQEETSVALIQLRHTSLYDEVVNLVRTPSCDVHRALPLALLKRILDSPAVLRLLSRDAHRLDLLLRTLSACLFYVTQLVFASQQLEAAGAFAGVPPGLSVRQKMKPIVIYVLECCSHLSVMEGLRSVLARVFPTSMSIMPILVMYQNDAEVVFCMTGAIKRLGFGLNQRRPFLTMPFPRPTT